MLIFTVADLLAFFAAGLVIGYVVMAGIAKVIRQSRCSHDEGVTETSACDAICKRCNKNLGFIGTYRDGKKSL